MCLYITRVSTQIVYGVWTSSSFLCLEVYGQTQKVHILVTCYSVVQSYMLVKYSRNQTGNRHLSMLYSISLGEGGGYLFAGAIDRAGGANLPEYPVKWFVRFLNLTVVRALQNCYWFIQLMFIIVLFFGTRMVTRISFLSLREGRK